MTNATITAEALVSRYAKDVAYVAEESPTTDLDTFIGQLGTAAERFDMAGINGHEDVETAAIHLGEARNSADESARNVFLRRADELLRPVVRDMADEYRTMAGD